MSRERENASDQVLYNFQLYKRGIVTHWECMEEIAISLSTLAYREMVEVLPGRLLGRYAQWAKLWLKKYSEGTLPLRADAHPGRETVVARTLNRILSECRLARAGAL